VGVVTFKILAKTLFIYSHTRIILIPPPQVPRSHFSLEKKMDVPRVNLSKFLTELSNMFRQSFNLLVHFQVATGVEKEEVVESTKTSRM
jgi:hypothetical protein